MCPFLMTPALVQGFFTIPTASNDLHAIFTLLIGVVAVLWLVYAVIGIAVYLLGAAAIFGARALIRAGRRHVRNKRELATTEIDADQAKIVYFDRYRLSNRCSGRHQHPGALDPGPGDDHPA